MKVPSFHFFKKYVFLFGFGVNQGTFCCTNDVAHNHGNVTLCTSAWLTAFHLSWSQNLKRPGLSIRNLIQSLMRWFKCCFFFFLTMQISNRTLYCSLLKAYRPINRCQAVVSDVQTINGQSTHTQAHPLKQIVAYSVTVYILCCLSFLCELNCVFVLGVPYNFL